MELDHQLVEDVRRWLDTRSARQALATYLMNGHGAMLAGVGGTYTFDIVCGRVAAIGNHAAVWKLRQERERGVPIWPAELQALAERTAAQVVEVCALARLGAYAQDGEGA